MFGDQVDNRNWTGKTYFHVQLGKSPVVRQMSGTKHWDISKLLWWSQGQLYGCHFWGAYQNSAGTNEHRHQ